MKILLGLMRIDMPLVHGHGLRIESSPLVNFVTIISFRRFPAEDPTLEIDSIYKTGGV